MDLRPLFDPTFFIGLTFLGIVVPIFTLSVSLIGHAVERAKEKNKENRKSAEEQLKKDMELLEKQLQESKEQNFMNKVQEIESNLDKLKKSRKRFEKESTKIIKRYDMLKFKESVLIPGFYFSSAIIFSLVAKIYTLYGRDNLFWFISVVFLILGICRICRCLNVIQEIGLSSDKYQQEKMFEAISKAFETRAAAEQPALALHFKEYGQLFKFPKDSEININFFVNLTQGKIARRTKILFMVPKEFDFPRNANKWSQDNDYTIPSALTTVHSVGDVRIGIFQAGSIVIKTPSQPGKYKMGYNLNSEEFVKREFFDIEII